MSHVPVIEFGVFVRFNIGTPGDRDIGRWAGCWASAGAGGVVRVVLLSRVLRARMVPQVFSTLYYSTNVLVCQGWGGVWQEIVAKSRGNLPQVCQRRMF